MSNWILVPLGVMLVLIAFGGPILTYNYTMTPGAVETSWSSWMYHEQGDRLTIEEATTDAYDEPMDAAQRRELLDGRFSGP